MGETREITWAEYARMLAAIQRVVTKELAGAAEGMWNPAFCASEADTRALDDIATIIGHYRTGGYRVTRPSPYGGN